MLNPKSVANYFIELARANNEPLDPMKLQKLVYYAQGWYAGYTGQPLINESIEAWPFGPVVPSLYHEFKKYGYSPIREKAKDYVNGVYGEVPIPAVPSINQFLNNIWNSYARFTGVALSEMTHAQGSPWHQAMMSNPGVRSIDIPFDAIAQHFRTVVQNSQQQGQNAQ